jgi:tetratricopeptide (TPR) repeat protein
MDNSSQHTETIIKYLDRELTGADLKAFEQLLSQDNSVREELTNLQLAQKAVISYGLKAQVASVRGEMLKDAQNNDRDTSARMYSFIRPALKVAAGLLFFLLAIGVYQYATVSPSKVYDESYQPYKAGVLRGGTNTELEAAYVSGKSKTVIRLFEKMTAPDNKASFLAGQSYLSIQQPKKAIQAFNNILRSPQKIYKDDAEYYLALSYLEDNQPVKARALFKKIYQDNDHLYHDRVSYWTLLKLKLLILKTRAR